MDGRTDRQTDGQTDRRTDTVAYRDARTHLKTDIFIEVMIGMYQLQIFLHTLYGSF